MSDIVERLIAPAYWISGSSEGHEGENDAPLEAADEIERLRAEEYNHAITCRAIPDEFALEPPDGGDVKPWEAVSEMANTITRLRAALRNVMIGGNHLAQVLGIGHLAAGSSYETALEFYGPGPNYDVWCCWNAIMEARAALKESGDA